MLDTMAHRGPDDEGSVTFAASGRPECQYFGPATPESARISLGLRPPGRATAAPAQVGLGHRRLAIIDPTTAGHQPMSYDGGRYWITCNGAIYNHVELRAELAAAGMTFRSTSDTEVLLAAYARWGVGCLPRLNGMWAFLLLDRERDELVVARDRLGVKPLYYTQARGRLLFASQIRALLAVPGVPAQADSVELADYLTWGSDFAQARTPFAGILRFPAAHYARVPLSRPGVKPERFWEMTPSTDREPFRADRARSLAGQYRDLLADAVRVRLRADVPVATALSGGLDSASVAYLATRVRAEQGEREPHRTFSSVHHSPEAAAYDESELIAAITAHCRLTSLTVEPDPAEFIELHGQAMAAWECLPDSSVVGGLVTYRAAARAGIRVTLDGQGADEQLAGYRYHWFTHLQNLPVPTALRQGWAIARTMGAGDVVRFALGYRIARAVTGRDTPPTALRRRFGPNPDNFHRTVSADPARFTTPLNDMLAQDARVVLAGLLHSADARSMFHSMEARSPFLDFRLVEFLAGVPSTYKIHAGYSKYLARLAFAGLLPDEVVWRRDKLGWSMPEDYWFAGPSAAWFAERRAAAMVPAGADLDFVSYPAVRPQGVRLVNLAGWQDAFFPAGGG